MMSMGKGRGLAQFLSKGAKGRRLRCVNLALTRGEGVQNPENLANVICDCPLMQLFMYIQVRTLTETHSRGYISGFGGWVATAGNFVCGGAPRDLTTTTKKIPRKGWVNCRGGVG